MPGICGKVNNEESVKIMTEELLDNQKLEIKGIYEDNLVGISQVSLNDLNYSQFEDNNYALFIEGNIYNLDEVNKLFNLNATDFNSLIIKSIAMSTGGGWREHCPKLTDIFADACMIKKIKKYFVLLTDLV